MPDYIEFLNWPDVGSYKRSQIHRYDDMTLEEIYGEYLKLKNKNPKISDEELSQIVGKKAYYFGYIKRKIRKLSCKKRLLKSV